MPKKQYRVEGPHRVLEHDPGTTFTVELDPDFEALLLERGSLSIVPQQDVHKPASPPRGGSKTKE
jgi:hypothetical protein